MDPRPLPATLRVKGGERTVHDFAISPRVSREVWPARSALSHQGRRECRAPDAPDSRVCNGSGSRHTRCQVTPESPGIPHAMVYGL